MPGRWTRRLAGSVVAAVCSLVVATLPAVGSGTGWAHVAPAKSSRIWFVAAGARSGTGTAARPFGSLGTALSSAQPGDTVSVGPGRYSGPVATMRAGLPGAPIVIQGRGAALTGDGTGRLVSVNHSYVTIQGFDISRAGKGIWIQQADHVRIVGNTLHDLGGECIRLKYHAVANEIVANRIGPCGLENFDLAANHHNGEGGGSTAPRCGPRTVREACSGSDRRRSTARSGG